MHSLVRTLVVALWLSAIALCASPVHAQSPTNFLSSLPLSQQEEVLIAAQQMHEASLPGPRSVDVDGQAILVLPAGLRWVPGYAMTWMIRTMGLSPDTGMIAGAVIPEDGKWMQMVIFKPVGYVREDTLRSFPLDELLNAMRKGLDKPNQRRREAGVPPFEIKSWEQPPQYDPKTHRIGWAVNFSIAGSEANSSLISYHTIALGREGYLMSWTLVFRAADFSAAKPVADYLVANTYFTDGHRFEDFDQATDRVTSARVIELLTGMRPSDYPTMLPMFGLLFAAIACVVIGWQLWQIRGRRQVAAAHDTLPPDDPPQGPSS